MEQKTASHVNEKVYSYTLEFSGTAIDFAELHGNRASEYRMKIVY